MLLWSDRNDKLIPSTGQQYESIKDKEKSKMKVHEY